MKRETEQILKEFEVKTFGNVKNIENAESKLRPGEKILYLSPTNAIITTVNIRKQEKLPGISVLTNQRFFFVYKSLNIENTEEFSLDTLNSINCSGNGITGGHIQLHTNTKSYDLLITYKKDIMEKIRNTFTNAKLNLNISSTMNISIITTNDIPEQIEKLSQLKNSGILTEDEFNSKKAELLARL